MTKAGGGGLDLLLHLVYHVLHLSAPVQDLSCPLVHLTVGSDLAYQVLVDALVLVYYLQVLVQLHVYHSVVLRFLLVVHHFLVPLFYHLVDVLLFPPKSTDPYLSSLYVRDNLEFSYLLFRSYYS